MRTNPIAHIALSALLCTAVACTGSDDSKKASKEGEDPESVNVPPDKGKKGFQIPAPPDVGSVPDDAEKSKTGLAYKLLEAGKGSERPSMNDTVLVHLTGWRENGEMHNTTRRNKPHPMVVSQSPLGWQEGLRMMTVGEKRRFWMSPRLAFFGDAKNAPRETMTYDVELVEIRKAPPVPEDVAVPPADAAKTKSGIAYRALSEGTGKDHPGEWDEVRVHFTGWNTKGQMFATTRMKKKPQVFPLYRKGPVWTEILQTMVVGQKSRFWVPAEVAQRKQGAAAGAQVFDIELLALTKQQPAPPAPKNVGEPPADAKKALRGALYKRVKKGTGKKKPTDKSLVTVHFTTWSTKGELRDSSVTRGDPVEFAMNQLPIPAWSGVLKSMVAGEITHVWIPADKMPRNKGQRPIKEMFVFQLELVSVRPRPEPPPAPKDVAAPPENAQKTDKGVYYVLLKKGSGTRHPTPRDKVLANYSGWTTDGNRFDSSIPKGQPAEFSMSRVIAGWTDGLQTMVEGEKKRFWIPEELAYKGKPGRPAGMLVFDVELVKIK